MQLLTYAFVALVLPLALVTRRQPGSRRALWAAALSVFAVSAMHLSQLHTGDAAWPVELLGHHASVPLAFAILYQDFPFALADLFLKRALTLVALLGMALLGVAAVGVIHSPDVPLRDPRDIGVLVTFWVATAVCYPTLRRGIDWFVDHVLLHRPDYTQLHAEIAYRVRRHQEIPALLDDICAQLMPALSARVVNWRQAESDNPPHPAASDGAGVAVRVDVPVAEPPQFAIEVSELTRGRRLFSDDRAALDAVAGLVGRRIDAIRLAHERYEREIRDQEMGKLATEAELRALRAQINPHFLFNALTTLGYLIQQAPARALDTLMRLTTLLRSVLRSEGEFTTLGHEQELIECYLQIERERFEERLDAQVDVPASLTGIAIPALIVQPLVENAIKHGIARSREGGRVLVTARLDRDDGDLRIVVRNTGAPLNGRTPAPGGGIGLQSVERRLRCYYGEAAGLTLTRADNGETVAELRLPASAARDDDVDVVVGSIRP
jgi:two-component system, LytTR family, sensor kinase